MIDISDIVYDGDSRKDRSSDALDEVEDWADDNGLDGFIGAAAQGEGRRFLERLRKVVQRGLDQGSLKSADVPADLAQELAARLDPSGLRPGREQEALRSLVESHAGLREGAQFLSRELRKRNAILDPREEADFLRALVAKAPPALQRTLEEIDAYEALCRPLTDTFDWIRHWASLRRGAPFGRADFEKEQRSATLLQAVQAGLRRVAAVDRLLVADTAARTLVNRFEGAQSAGDLYDSVIEFHRFIQAEKPPGGKRPWIEPQASGKGVVVRAAYVLEDPPDPFSPYVHEYRLPTLSRFLADLGVIS